MVIKPYDFEDDHMFLSLAEFDYVLSGRLETEFLICILLLFFIFYCHRLSNSSILILTILGNVDILGQAIDVGEL